MLNISIAYDTNIECSKQKIEEEMYCIVASNAELEREIRVAREAEKKLRKNRTRLAQLSKVYAGLEVEK